MLKYRKSRGEDAKKKPTIYMQVIVVIALLLAISISVVHSSSVPCDIVIAGGSAASLAAGITAARADKTIKVCLLDPTDWLGGQLTASGVTGIDFGDYNRFESNQPESFRELFEHIPGNPGACWVSYKCYTPNWLVDTFVEPKVQELENLVVFKRTVVSSTERDAITGEIKSITAIQRTPVNEDEEWSVVLSQDLHDWYTPEPSSRFRKNVLKFTAPIFIEATEFGDVLMTSGVKVEQGVEIPNENDATLDDQCGQAITITYFMSKAATPQQQQPPVPAGSDEYLPFGYEGFANSFAHVWTYRRAYAAGDKGVESVSTGDITQQNWNGGNDLNNAYLFLPLNASQTEHRWMGGINTTALSMAEQRAYGSYHWIITKADPATQEFFFLDRNVTNTGTGLSKMPYLRDTRRAVGLDGFKLNYTHLIGEGGFGVHFEDTVALGNYNGDTHGLVSCHLPGYLNNHTTLNNNPFYIPFRALTVDGAPNLLVCGKTMAQTFHANSATRLHPTEWTTGVAAAGSAVFMLHNKLSKTEQVLADIHSLRSYLNSTAIGQPLEWTMQK